MKLLFLILAAVVAAASCQQQCGCAPAPVIIQLSCGGTGSAPEVAPPAAPPPKTDVPPPPPSTSAPEEFSSVPSDYFETTTVNTENEATSNSSLAPEESISSTESVSASTLKRIQDDPDRSKCNWQGSGLGIKRLTFDGYFVEEWMTISDTWRLTKPSERNETVHWFKEPQNARPPPNWNGSIDALPSPLPEKDTDFYKWLLCWPLLPSSQPETSTELSILEDPDMRKCDWKHDFNNTSDRNGVPVKYSYPGGNLEGGFPSGFKIVHIQKIMKEAKQTEIESPNSYPRPPHDWDGRPSTLGFPMPAKNTPEYNMLLCWPYDVTFAPKDSTEYPNRIQDNPDRSKCNWQGTAAGYKLLTFGGELVDEGNIRLSQDWKRFYLYNLNLSVFWFEHDNSTPPSDWDGSFDSLPFPKPKKDSAQYKFLICWPIPGKEETSTELSILDDNDIIKCYWDSDFKRYDKNGVEVYYFYPKENHEGGFPSGYRTSEVATWELKANQSEIESPVGYPRPPQDWDGRPSTLGFPLPAKNTPEYNMLLCWPYDVTFTKQ